MAIRYITQISPNPDYYLQILDTEDNVVIGQFKIGEVAEAVKDGLNEGADISVLYPNEVKE